MIKAHFFKHRLLLNIIMQAPYFYDQLQKRYHPWPESPWKTWWPESPGFTVYQEKIDTYVEECNTALVKDEEFAPLNKDNIFNECTTCKVVKCVKEFSSPTLCKVCKKIKQQQHLKDNPNAFKADEYRRWLYNGLNGKSNIDTESLTGLPLNELKAWMHYTKQFYIPKGYTGKIEIEHMYPLSKYDMFNIEDVKHCLNWKHLRYMTSQQNKKKLNKDPTPEDKLKQLSMVYSFVKM
jgi:hypothetical protein